MDIFNKIYANKSDKYFNEFIKLCTTFVNLYKANGYSVKILNFANMNNSCGWDLMLPIREEVDERAQELLADTYANVFISNNYTDLQNNEIYLTGSRALLKALLLRFVLDPNIPESEKTFKVFFEWIKMIHNEDFLDKLFNESTLPTAATKSLFPYQQFRNLSEISRNAIIVRILSETENLAGSKPNDPFHSLPIRKSGSWSVPLPLRSHPSSVISTGSISTCLPWLRRSLLYA